MAKITTTEGLPFITDTGLSVMANVIHEDDQQPGRTYVVGRFYSAGARKLARDGYLTLVRPAQYALSDSNGQVWARLYREARAALIAYGDVIREPDSDRDAVSRTAYAAHLGRVDGFGSLATAALLALFPGLGYDKAKGWAAEAALDEVGPVRIAQHFGEHHRR